MHTVNLTRKPQIKIIEQTKWLSGWSYRDTWTVKNTSANDLDNVVVRIELDDSNFDFAKARPDGQDIRFTTVEGIEIPHYIEKYDSTGSALIYVKIPKLFANETKVIYLYYGNDSATYDNDGSKVFEDYVAFHEDPQHSGVVFTEYMETINLPVRYYWRLAVADGTTTSYSGTVKDVPIDKTTDNVYVHYTIGGTEYTAQDDGNGNISGTDVSGTIDYDTGDVSLTFTTAPDNGTEIRVEYISSVGQSVHPSVWYFPNGWNGYKYWMAVTPYPGEDAHPEDAYIFVSNDGKNFIEPPGFKNPVFGWKNKPWDVWHSDNVLFYDEKEDKLYCFVRETNDATKEDYILVTWTTDGVNWANPQYCNFSPNPEYCNNISPSVWKEDDGKWRMWVVNTRTLGWQVSEYTDIDIYESTDAINWTYVGKCNLNLKNWAIWHQEVRKIKGEYWMLAAVFHKDEPDADTLQMALILGRSKNGVDWRFYEHQPFYFGRFHLTYVVGSETILGFWDYVYKSSFIVDENNVCRAWLTLFRKSENPTIEKIGVSLPRDWNELLESLESHSTFHFWMPEEGSMQFDSTNKSDLYGCEGSVRQTQTGWAFLVAKRFIPVHGVPLNIQVYFYDSMEYENALTMFRVGRSTNRFMEWGIGLNYGYSTTHYVWAKNWPGYNVSSVARSKGWHKFELRINGSTFEYYIDGTKVGEYTDWADSPLYAEFYTDGETKGLSVWWDDYKCFRAYQDFGIVEVSKNE